MNREEIIERLQYTSKTISTSNTDVFSSNVSEGKIRYIVAIYIIGNNTATQLITIKKKKEDGSYDTIFNNIAISPTDLRQLPYTYDVENPLLKLAGGTNLAGIVDANTVNITIIWYDNEP